MSHENPLVILYTRPGCHLCEEAKEQMLAANCADQYELEEINIDTNPKLVERYGTLIPVIAINGVDAFRYRVTAAAFRKAVQTCEAGDSISAWGVSPRNDA